LTTKETLRKIEFDKIQESLKSYCYSELGQNYIDNLIIYTNIFDIKYELNLVRDIKDYMILGNDLALEGLSNIRNLLAKLKIPGSFIQPEKYLLILNFLKTSRIVKSQINSFTKPESDLRKLSEEIFTDKILEHNIESVIDSSGNVKDNASRELKRIRENLLEKREILRKQLSRILKKVSEQELIQDDIISLRDGRSVIPVKVENKRKVQGIIHSSSSTGYTVFIEPAETIELNNDITELTDDERREIEKILRYLSEDISKYVNEINVNIDVLAKIEYCRAKAKYAIDYECSEPMFENDKINILKAYHPILLKKYDKNTVIPLELKIEKDKNTIVITGPNAGGKTVALKTLGLLQVMLQSGMQIPVSPDSDFKIYENVFVVIGDEQSIENSLSSFGSHLKELKNVLDNSNDKSLVLIDEICSGTDPSFGSALSLAILKELSRRNSLTVVTTHISDLKIYAHNEEKFINASLEYDFEKLEPSFKFMLGIPGQSYTFELAKKFRIPDEIISEAKTHLVKDEHNLEELLKVLNDAKTSFAKNNEELERKNKIMNNLLSDYEEKMNNIKQKEREIIKEAQIKSKSILDSGNKLIEKTIKEVREKEKSIAKIKTEYKTESEKIIPEIDKSTNEIENISTGDIVILKKSNSRGEVIEVNGNKIVLKTNGLIIKTNIESISKIEKSTEKSIADYNIVLKESFNTTLDLRGKYTFEILDILENFIYEGHINSVNELTVVHGKGTGSLRKTVHNFLKSNKFVQSFRLGNWNEGDSGATIIELKQ